MPPRMARTPRTKVLKLALVVEVCVTEGKVTDDDMVRWLQTAADDYHRWRNGFVGIGAHAKIKPPDLSIVGEES